MQKDYLYQPNQIPADERLKNIAFSILLFAYGTYGVWVNDLYIPGKRSKGVHLHDVPAWIMYGAIICACLVMLSVVVAMAVTRSYHDARTHPDIMAIMHKETGEKHDPGLMRVFCEIIESSQLKATRI